MVPAGGIVTLVRTPDVFIRIRSLRLVYSTAVCMSVTSLSVGGVAAVFHEPVPGRAFVDFEICDLHDECKESWEMGKICAASRTLAALEHYGYPRWDRYHLPNDLYAHPGASISLELVNETSAAHDVRGWYECEEL